MAAVKGAGWVGAVVLAVAALDVPADAAVRSGETRRLGNSTDVVAAAIDLSQGAWEDNAATVVALGRADLFPDSLAGAAWAGTRGPVLFTAGGAVATLSPAVRAEIERVLPEPNGCDGSSTIAVLGGTGAISSAVEDELVDDGWCVERFGGANRVETAVHIATDVRDVGDASRVLIASAANWPDAATGSAYAAATGHPIVVTFPDALDPAVARFLEETAPEEIVLLGGTGALSAAVESSAEDIAPTRRVAGASRDETAVAIADELWVPLEPTGVTFLNGYADTSWAYAIAAAVNAALDNTPQLFADSLGLTITPAVAAHLDRTPDAFTITVGPSSLVGDTVELAVRARRALEPIPGTTVRYRNDYWLPSIDHDEAVEYGRADDIDGNEVVLRMEIRSPADDTVDERPLLIIVHGGGFQLGDRHQLAGVAEAWAHRGWVTAAIDYRLLPAGRCLKFMNGTTVVTDEAEITNDTTVERVDDAACEAAAVMATDDVQSAVRYLRSHASENGIDINRIAAFGWSAGSHAALRAGFSVTEEPDATIDAVVGLAGGVSADAIPMIGPGDAPSMLFAATEDKMVPYGDLVWLHGRTLAGGARSTLVTFEGWGHIPSDWGGELAPRMARFYWHTLDLEHAAR